MSLGALNAQLSTLSAVWYHGPMSKLKVAFVGWRGMVGSVLDQRMKEENDFAVADISYFSTSQAGQTGPDGRPLGDAFDDAVLTDFDVILTAQGSDYTDAMHEKLRAKGWNGYWIDAASRLRMKDNALLVLDPVNRAVIDKGLDDGIKDLIGANCTVSTMMIGLTGLFQSGLIEWISAMTYQAASGAGAQNMVELLQQMRSLGNAVEPVIEDPTKGILDVDRAVSAHLKSSDFPIKAWPAPLAANVLPWIDSAVEDGMTREEWKGMVETNKILGSDTQIPVDGVCVRVGAMRSHSHGLTIKLKKDVPLTELETMIKDAHEWVKYVPNNPENTWRDLSPAAISGSLQIGVGRLRKSKLGPEYIHAFTVGDQLLWGAAEPLRRTLRILTER